MARVENTVFISYRRKDSWAALAVFNALAQHGYDVFIDYDGIASGDFERSIVDNIRARAHFVLVLTPTALERCADPDDWVRREIEEAMKWRRNIVPLLLDGFRFDSPAIQAQLTGSLEPLRRYNALEVPTHYFEAAMDKLRSRYLAVPVDAVTHPASDHAQRVAEQQRDAALRASAEHEPSVPAVSVQKGRQGLPRRQLLWLGAGAGAVVLGGALGGPALWFRWQLRQALADWTANPELYSEAKKQGMPVIAQAAEEGHVAAMDVMASAYASGRGGVEVDLQQAARWALKAAPAGGRRSMGILAGLYRAGDGGLPRDGRAADEWERRSFESAKVRAEGGDPRAMVELSEMLLKGRGTARDVVAGRSWLLKAADAGHAVAAATLAALHAQGKRGFAPDKALAEQFLARTAGASDPVALALKGVARAFLSADLPDGVPAEVVHDVSRAAEQGVVEVMEVLASWHTGESRFSKLRLDPELAAQWTQRAAATGAPMGMYLLANAHLSGLGSIPKDVAKGKQGLLRAVRAGHDKAALQWGNVLVLGQLGEEVNEAEGLRCITLAADRDSTDAMVTLGLLHGAGKFGLRPDPKVALHWIQRAAAQDDGRALFELAVAYSARNQLGLPRDDAQAVRLLEEAAQYGADARAAQQMGVLKEEGRLGVAIDPVGARRWYEQAAQLGEGEAAFRLFLACARGDWGQKVDDDQATSWLQRSADLGYADAQGMLGWALIRGELGLTRDARRGVASIRKAADNQHARSMADMGDFHLDGTGGTTVDRQEAVRWFRAAADAGDWYGMQRLAEAYAGGIGGLPRDPAQAAAWRAKAQPAQRAAAAAEAEKAARAARAGKAAAAVLAASAPASAPR